MCTCLRLSAENGAIVVGRTMEFGAPLGSMIAALPRGYNGSSPAPAGVSKQWQGRYGVVGASVFGSASTLADGLNEKGVYGGLLYMPGFCDYTPADGADPTTLLAPADMVSFVLQTCSSVAEIRAAMMAVMVWPSVVPAMGFAPPLHLVVHDASGDSAVFEWSDGEMVVFDNPIGVTTNSPHFDWHLLNLNNYVALTPSSPEGFELGGVTFAPFGQGVGFTGLPGDSSPPSRFVRASAFVASHERAANGAALEMQMFHIMNNFDIPPGSVVEGEAATPEYTRYTVLANLTDGHYIVRYMADPTPRLVDLTKTDFTTGPRQIDMPSDSWHDIEV